MEQSAVGLGTHDFMCLFKLTLRHLLSESTTQSQGGFPPAKIQSKDSIFYEILKDIIRRILLAKSRNVC